MVIHNMHNLLVIYFTMLLKLVLDCNLYKLIVLNLILLMQLVKHLNKHLFKFKNNLLVINPLLNIKEMIMMISLKLLNHPNNYKIL